METFVRLDVPSCASYATVHPYFWYEYGFSWSRYLVAVTLPHFKIQHLTDCKHVAGLHVMSSFALSQKLSPFPQIAKQLLCLSSAMCIIISSLSIWILAEDPGFLWSLRWKQNSQYVFYWHLSSFPFLFSITKQLHTNILKYRAVTILNTQSHLLLIIVHLNWKSSSSKDDIGLYVF